MDMSTFRNKKYNYILFVSIFLDKYTVFSKNLDMVYNTYSIIS